MILLQLVYAANVLVAGWIGVSSLFYPQYAHRSVFSGVYSASELTQLVGSLWLGIAVLSLAGLYWPANFVPVLVLQLFYKSCWLGFVAWPAHQKQKPYPKAMTYFFIVWIICLPFVIPWKQLLSTG